MTFPWWRMVSHVEEETLHWAMKRVWIAVWLFLNFPRKKKCLQYMIWELFQGVQVPTFINVFMGCILGFYPI